MNIERRKFILSGGLAAASAAVPGGASADAVTRPYEGIGNAPFEVGDPCLQAPGAHTMGVSWRVSGLAKGVVEIADNPEMRAARTVKSGGFGLVPIDIHALQVRLEGLESGKRYWYRTITTPFTDYKRIYDAKLGKPVVGAVHSFVTLGPSAPAHFCVMNDTHAKWPSFERVVAKITELHPTAVIWNGDATNTTQAKETAVQIFLDPPVEHRNYSADIPVFFESGNHDFRGSWISKKEEVVLPRHPAERTGAEWDLKWNFAERMGDVALIGLDTGEDKPDGHPKWFGLANFSPYRRAQAAWLERALARQDIASAKFKVVFCHIPLFAAPDHPDYPHDGVAIDPNDYAYWSRECHDLWSPLLVRGGVQLVIAAHKHLYRCDPATPDRPWMQLVGGGPELGVTRGKPDSRRFPTVIEGRVDGDKLVITVHDVFNGRVAATHVIRRGE